MWVGGAVFSLAGTAAVPAAPPPDTQRSPAASRLQPLTAADTEGARQAFERVLAAAGHIQEKTPAPRFTPREELLPGGGRRVSDHPRFLSTDRIEVGVGARVRLEAHPDRRHGTAPDGRMMIYAPDPIQPGSSISHWDTRASPDLLMEPFVRPGTSGTDPDLTVPLLEDLGWPRGSSSFRLVPLDRPQAGLFDPRPFGGAPGNPATTLGEARLNVLHHVFSVWEGIIGSNVAIDTKVLWVPLFCEAGRGAALAGAGPTGAFAEFEGLPSPELWYPAALAESLTGRD